MHMSPNSIHLLGYVVDDLMYFDVTLSMGSKLAAYCCKCTTDVVIYIYHNKGFDGLNYLDDLGSAEVEELAEMAFNCLGQIMQKIGIEESVSKAQPPACLASFLGVLYDTVNVTLTITPD